MKNEIKLYIHSVFYSLIVFAMGGSLVQTFLLESEFKEETVANLLSVLQIVQIVTIFVFSPMADRLKRYKTPTALSVLACIPLSVYLIYLSFFPGKYQSVVIYLIFGAVYNVFLGVYSILSYKLPYSVINMERYGIYNSVSGVIVGVLSFGISFLISTLQSVFDFFDIMRVVYVVTLAFVIGMVAVTFSFEEKTVEIKEIREGKKPNILKYRPFVILILPNVLRGFNTGMIGMTTTIGYYNGVIDSTSATVMMTATSIASILASLAYSFLTRRVREKYILLGSSAFIALFMSLMLPFGTTAAYIGFYFAAYFFMYTVSISVPVTISRTIDYDIIGQYSGGRLLLHTLGSSLAGFLCIPMMKLFGAQITMIVSGGVQLISGIVYYFFLNNFEKEKNMKI